jgi:glycosyltransferase involved in cell wall biosynthesis
MDLSPISPGLLDWTGKICAPQHGQSIAFLGRPSKPSLYIFGIPGRVGGAGTKIAHLIKLLHDAFAVTVVLPSAKILERSGAKYLVRSCAVRATTPKDLPKKLEGVALAICEKDFFSSNLASDIKRRGLKLVWSNEMMFPFPGEAEAAKSGLIDRVLFVSEFQQAAFEQIYQGVPSRLTGNYIDPRDYPWIERQHEVCTLGRLSRADPAKYPLDFPVFYEELGLGEVGYRVMAWSPDVHKQYRWHRFGPQWELLPADKEPVLKFLSSLDVFLYPLGHRVKESWGRAVVEAMLTGCVPVVPTGHQFHKLMVHGESGFICQQYSEWKTVVRELYENHKYRIQIARQAAEHARTKLCNPDEHRRIWVEALSC